MGQQPSSPQPGTSIRVIGAGLPRTGTSSFNLALSKLLNGPCYHGGTQCTLGPPNEISSWITLLSAFPARTPSQKSLIQSILHQRLDGYAAVTDSPCNGLIPELLELYPDAKVICTVRDPDAWVKSMDLVASVATFWLLGIILFPLPGLRHIPAYTQQLRRQWVTLYGMPEPATMLHWERHVAYLKRVVPEERLVFYDLRDGWGPLCEVLGVEVPDEEFPRVNDGKAIEELSRRMIIKGLKRWAVILGSVSAVGIAWWMVR